jgi:hypothetical protein
MQNHLRIVWQWNAAHPSLRAGNILFRRASEKSLYGGTLLFVGQSSVETGILNIKTAAKTGVQLWKQEQHSARVIY